RGVSLLKLRFGWGQLGNNRIGNFAYKDFVSGSDLYVYGSGLPAIKPGMNISQFGNKDIRWERTESIGPGLDFNMFNNRFTSSFDLFVKDTHDMLINVPIVYSAGIATAPMQNAGSVRNAGYEVQISYRDRIGKFGYEIGGNITQVKNEVTSLGAVGEPVYGGNLGSPNELGYINKTVVGAPIAGYYGWKTAGIMTESDFNENGSPIAPVFASGSTYSPGDMKFVDVNNDGVIDDNDRTFIGTPHPDFFYGFNIRLAYGNFELSGFFQGVYGNQLYDVTGYFRYSTVRYDGVWDINEATSFSNVASDYFDKVWRPAPNPDVPEYRDYWGANLDGKVPIPSSDGTKNKMNFRNSDFYIKDGSYLRLKNVQLTYTVPQKITNRLQLRNAKIYVSGTNLLTFTSYDGLDPEIGKTIGQEGNNLYIGIDQGIYPQARSYMFGLIVDF
ncbi:MAG: TonB-dependent receptor, partial [Dysgonamonadaceae bacterium]|nr:TonB-dependent receptor [Dysgonamonadaceae bacterium]